MFSREPCTWHLPLIQRISPGFLLGAWKYGSGELHDKYIYRSQSYFSHVSAFILEVNQVFRVGYLLFDFYSRHTLTDHFLRLTAVLYWPFYFRRKIFFRDPFHSELFSLVRISFLFVLVLLCKQIELTIRFL